MTPWTCNKIIFKAEYISYDKSMVYTIIHKFTIFYNSILLSSIRLYQGILLVQLLIYLLILFYLIIFRGRYFRMWDTID